MIMIFMTRLQNVSHVCEFHTWTDEVKESLFRGYCMQLYTAHLWSNY